MKRVYVNPTIEVAGVTPLTTILSASGGVKQKTDEATPISSGSLG